MIAASITSVLTVIALPSGLVLGANELLNETGGDKVDNNATISIPLTPVTMLAVTNSRNEVASLALLAVDPQLQGGTIVSVPVGARADVADGEAPRRISDSYVTGGVTALKTDVENLLNVSLENVDVLTATELASVLAPVGTQPVSLPQPVFDTAADGTTVTVLEAGTPTVGALQIAAALASSQTGSPESTRLAQVKALWLSVARAGVVRSSGPRPRLIRPKFHRQLPSSLVHCLQAKLMSGNLAPHC
jgi:hypothetical protein